MSFEAIAYARKRGETCQHTQRWLTVPTNDKAAARAAFDALGFETRGITIHTQAEARAIAERL